MYTVKNAGDCLKEEQRFRNYMNTFLMQSGNLMKMKRIYHILALCSLILVSCGPVKHVVHVEMRYPSKSGIELAGKNISVIYLTDCNEVSDGFNESMAEGFAKAMEQDYGTGEGSVGVYRLADTGGKYDHKDTLVNLLRGKHTTRMFDQ